MGRIMKPKVQIRLVNVSHYIPQAKEPYVIHHDNKTYIYYGYIDMHDDGCNYRLCKVDKVMKIGEEEEDI